MKTRIVLSCLLLLLTHSANAADGGGEIYTDPDLAPVDYKIQGEYEGQAGPKKTTYGVQITALGKGKFHLRSYEGGLPGNDVSHKEIKVELDGQLDGEYATFSSDVFEITAGGGKLRVRTLKDNVVQGTLDRVVRKSNTLGAKAPEGATVLFDGTTADNFDGGKLEGKLLAANCSSKAKFGDHQLHLEFRTPFKPNARGQGRGNSGVYVQSRYEIQVLDSFALDGKNNECGGIYSISEPSVNMCYPPLQWQTYDIDFTAARYDSDGKKTASAKITVRHNGVVIHDDIELPHGTPGRHKEGPGPDALYLQGHGNPVFYRNIWVVEK